MSQNHNALGKTPYQCSCGYRVNLEQYEIADWIQRHSALFTGIEHKINQIGDVIGVEAAMGPKDFANIVANIMVQLQQQKGKN